VEIPFLTPREIKPHDETGGEVRRGHIETFAECSILFKFKESEDFNHRNILDISRIKI